jgi:ABC-2 type transport system ATP-binding protein
VNIGNAQAGGVSAPVGDERAPAFELVGLHKVFGDYAAVDHVNLTVAPGSLYGLVGPNGAGKTTALSMAVGLQRPDDGYARIFGVDIWREPAKAKALLGVLPDGLAMPEQLTGRELLNYLGQVRGLDSTSAAERAGELLAVMELDGDVERTLIIDYSTGMRKKIGLATALLHGPKLLVLDEPFEAVDPVSAATLKRILRRFVRGGGSVLLSSHVMALVEEMCDTVAVMAKGKVLAEGPLEQVRGQGTLEETFVKLVGARVGGGEGLSWLGS